MSCSFLGLPVWVWIVISLVFISSIMCQEKENFSDVKKNNIKVTIIANVTIWLSCLKLSIHLNGRHQITLRILIPTDILLADQSRMYPPYLSLHCMY